MKEKITRLAKGIAESEAPKLVMLPESYSGSIKADTKDCFTVEFQSLNGYSVKGVCFSDAMKMCIRDRPIAMLTIRPMIQTATKIRPNIAKKRLSLPSEPSGFFDVSISLDVLSRCV